jgi:hypothetical protein
MRRSTVLSLPLQLVFPACGYKVGLGKIKKTEVSKLIDSKSPAVFPKCLLSGFKIEQKPTMLTEIRQMALTTLSHFHQSPNGPSYKTFLS